MFECCCLLSLCWWLIIIKPVPVSAWWQCGCRQPPATTHHNHCPLFLAEILFTSPHSTPARSAHTDNFTIRHSHNRAQCSGPVPNLILMIGYCWPWLLSWTSNIALLKCSLWRYTIRVSFSSLWFRLFYFAASLTSVIARCLPLSAAVMLPGHGTQCTVGDDVQPGQMAISGQKPSWAHILVAYAPPYTAK